MSKDQVAKLVTLPANADLSAKQYYLCKLADASGVAQVAVSGDGNDAIGSIYEGGSAQGEATVVAIGGIIKCIAGATLSTSGVRVASDSAGKLSAVGTADKSLGFLLNSAVSGDIVDVLWNPIG